MSKAKGGKRLNKRIALELKQYAKDNPNLSQREVGLKFGVTRESVNRIVNGKFY